MTSQSQGQYLNSNMIMHWLPMYIAGIVRNGFTVHDVVNQRKVGHNYDNDNDNDKCLFFPVRI